MKKKSEFEWLDEEDDSFFDAVPMPAVRHSRFWNRIGFWLLLLLTIFGFVSYFLLDRKQSTLEDAAYQDVVAGLELWHEAVLNNDLELFNLTLLNEDRHWQLEQKKLLNKSLILDREPIGLLIQDDGIKEPVVEFSADLQRAIVTYKQEFQAEPPTNLGFLNLMYSAVYQKNGSAWRYAPRDDAYWGEWQKEESEFLDVEFKERDAEMAQRIAYDLNEQLREICQKHGMYSRGGITCSGTAPFTLTFSTDPSTLESFSSSAASLLQNQTIMLPTPSLVGLPVDENGYDVVYEGYARIVREHFESFINMPLSLPEEAIYSLCFDYPKGGFRLFRYDTHSDIWTSEIPQRAFLSLRALSDDQGLILQEAAAENLANRLRLLQYRDFKESVLLDITFSGTSFRPIGWAGFDQKPRLLLQRNYNGPSPVDYGWLDIQACAAGDCNIGELSGYPSWSSDGEHTLLVNGSDVSLGNQIGQISEFVGSGFNPFWLDREIYGFIRFNNKATDISTEIVVGDLLSKDQFVLLDSDALSRFTESSAGENVVIQYVTPNPGNLDQLILSASGVRDLAGEYFIFSYQLPEDMTTGGDGEIKLLMHHRGSPGGTPASLTPTGFPPLEVSPDGRWLLVSELASDSKNTWSFYFIPLDQTVPQQMTESFPVLPAQFPFFDWSKDGQWLVIADHGFFRLIAPDYDYERLIPHEFDSCSYTVWSK